MDLPEPARMFPGKRNKEIPTTTGDAPAILLPPLYVSYKSEQFARVEKKGPLFRAVLVADLGLLHRSSRRCTPLINMPGGVLETDT